jgi:outer membrane biosynthesis protein TonB
VAAVNRGVVRALALGQIVTALVLLLVAFVAVRNGSEVEALRAELADTRARLVAAESDRDRLQDRVDLLERALLMAGIDPDTITVEPSLSTAPGPSSTTAPERQASSAPAGRETSRPRPAENEPDSQSSPQPEPEPNPENPPPPPQDPPPEEEPCPVPELPIVGCPV